MSRPRTMYGTTVKSDDHLAFHCTYCRQPLGEPHQLSCPTQVPKLDPHKTYVKCPECHGGRQYDDYDPEIWWYCRCCKGTNKIPVDL